MLTFTNRGASTPGDLSDNCYEVSMSLAFEYNKSQLKRFITFAETYGEMVLTNALDKAFDLLIPFKDDTSKSRTTLAQNITSESLNIT